MRIYKWQLETTDRQTLPLQRDAQALTVQVQHGVPCLWCLVDPDQPVQPQVIYICGTGHPTHPEATAESYIGTYQLHSGGLVFHVFAPGMLPSVAARLSFLEGAVTALRDAS